MPRESSAVDHIVALATSAKEMWSMDTGAWEIRAQSRARSRRSSQAREVTLVVRFDSWSTRLRRVAFGVSVAMIAVAIGFALRGKAPTVVSVADAAPAAAVAPASAITVTPIEETITVTPIDVEPEAAPARTKPAQQDSIKKAKSSHKKVRGRKAASHRAKKKR